MRSRGWLLIGRTCPILPRMKAPSSSVTVPPSLPNFGAFAPLFVSKASSLSDFSRFPGRFGPYFLACQDVIVNCLLGSVCWRSEQNTTQPPPRRFTLPPPPHAVISLSVDLVTKNHITATPSFVGRATPGVRRCPEGGELTTRRDHTARCTRRTRGPFMSAKSSFLWS